jgi:hypothetical protein
MHHTNTAPPTDGVLANYLSRDQLADELGVTTRTISRWRWNRKGPPAHRIAGRVMFKRADVVVWLEQQREECA